VSKSNIVRVLPIALFAAALAPLRAARPGSPSKAPATPPPSVTFNRDIAPIVFHSCASCHRPGEAGPFPLLTYDDVKKHARQIVAVTRSRIMPPWLPEPGAFAFADEMRLSDQQIALFQQWAEQGTPEGDARDLPRRPAFVEGWQLGQPDLIVRAEKPFSLPAGGGDTYWNFVLRVPVDHTRWVRAVEIRPGDKRLVHHANILVDRMENARSREVAPGAGFGGMEIRIESETFDPDSHFLFWKPGTPPYVYPDGMALRLDKGTDLVLNVHLQPSGKPEVIQPSLGIYFTDQPATLQPMLLQMENDAALDIPANAKDFLVSDDFVLPLAVDLLAIYPHAHYLGKDIEATATLPGGAKKTLIHIKHWDLNWQAVYRYAQPVFLPKGTVVSMRYTYDNSSDNYANPNHPPQRVTAGNRFRDEMAHLWLQVLPVHYDRSGDPRLVLQEALMRHQIEKNPSDFDARYNLGATLQASGKPQEAMAEYQAALQLHPDDAVANNAFGGLLLATGNVTEAINHLKMALDARPDYFDAHYNLGNAFAAQDDFAAAAEQFRAAVKLNPEDADAEANLGSALAESGDLLEAKAHFERALAINPNHALARENLEQLLHAAAAH